MPRMCGNLLHLMVWIYLAIMPCLWDVWDSVCSKITSHDIQLFGLLMWGIRRERNKILYNGAVAFPNCVVASAQGI